MSQRRVGLWLIGAFGGVGTTATLGLSAWSRGLIDTTSLVTALPLFDPLGLDAPTSFVVGGHEIRKGGFRQTVRELQERSNIFELALSQACEPDLARWEANVRPGTVLNAGATIAGLADLPETQKYDTPRRAIDQIQADLKSFQAAHKLDQVVVLNVSSTEPPFELSDVHQTAGRALARAGTLARPCCRRRRSTPRPPSTSASRTSTSRLRWERRSPALLELAEKRQDRHRRQGRQDRRDADEVGAGADVRPAQLADPELGRPQHLRQPRRPGPRRPGQQGVQGPNQGPGRSRASSATSRRRTGHHRVHRVAGRLEDGLGPHPLQGLSGHEDDAAVHLAGLRLDPGRPRWCSTWPAWPCSRSAAAKSAS